MKYLLDSNTLIYASQPEARYVQCRDWIERESVAISAISRAEVLGFHRLTETDAVLDRTVKIRQQLRIKTPDAIVAAAALVYGLELVTADAGFARVAGMSIINPLL